MEIFEGPLFSLPQCSTPLTGPPMPNGGRPTSDILQYVVPINKKDSRFVFYQQLRETRNILIQEFHRKELPVISPLLNTILRSDCITMLQGHLPSSLLSFPFSPKDIHRLAPYHLPSQTYFFCLQSPSATSTFKMLLQSQLLYDGPNFF